MQTASRSPYPWKQAGTEEVARRRLVPCLLAEEEGREKKGNFANTPLGFSVITETFKIEISHIFLELLDNSNNLGRNSWSLIIL